MPSAKGASRARARSCQPSRRDKARTKETSSSAIGRKRFLRLNVPGSAAPAAFFLRPAPGVNRP